MLELSDKQKLIIDTYRQIVIDKSRIPTYSDFLDNNITESQVRTSFGSLTRLHGIVENDFPEILSDNLAHESQIFHEQRIEELSEDLKKYQRFVITTAVNGKEVFKPFFQSLKKYCELNDALLLIMACSDVASTRTSSVGMAFDPILKDEYFISKEIKLNSRFFLAGIKTSAKQINPTTGLARIGKRNSSWVFASPKQFLEVHPTSTNVDRSPMAIMTTGAITLPNYNNDRYMSQRTSYIAEHDHVMGALIVEIEDDKKFHFRQLQANNKGEFVDFGTRYKPNGDTSTESSTLVLGDYHSGETSVEIIDSLHDLVKEANVLDIVLHDIFDGRSVNHHLIGNPLKLAKRSLLLQDNLEHELGIVGENINFLHSLIDGNLIIVKSNHDEWLERYLETGTYTKDPQNHYICLDLAKAYIDGEMPLKYGVETYGNILEPDRIVWLDRNEEFKISGVELGQHGDIGSGGKPATLNSIEKDIGRGVVGHIHSPAILRGIFRVGTSTNLQLDYNKKGASSWMHTHALVYNDGSVQLISLIGEKYKL